MHDLSLYDSYQSEWKSLLSLDSDTFYSVAESVKTYLFCSKNSHVTELFEMEISHVQFNLKLSRKCIGRIHILSLGSNIFTAII